MPDKKTVLVIDDDQDIRDLCRLVLEKEGYRVVLAADGAAGLAAAQADKPDLVILDIMMEEADSGFQVAQKLGSSLPILMLSSIAGAADQVFDTSTLPVSELVDKPIKPDKLLATVSRLLARGSS